MHAPGCWPYIKYRNVLTSVAPAVLYLQTAGAVLTGNLSLDAWLLAGL